jgi:DNA-binding HxlR family transcriptional regulator
MAKKMARRFGCPSEFTLHVLGGKWTTLILCYLEREPLRYADLRRLMPTLSDKMLSERLADLMERGLVEKMRFNGGPREVYVLTSTGRSLGAALVELYRWGADHAAVFGVTVGAPFGLTTWCVEPGASASTMDCSVEPARGT